MIDIKKKVLLASFTTFKIGGPAKYFCEVENQFDALSAFEFAKEKNAAVLLLGRGSNMLISDEGFDGLVMRIVNKGIEIISDESGSRMESGMTESVLLKAASGEKWDEVIKFAVSNNWWGIENLSHIPGSVGAIAVQNVGAYGQEAKNVIASVTVFDVNDLSIKNLKAEECGFGYRSSIFNSTQKGRYIIFFITFKLSKTPCPILEYRDLKQRFSSGKPSIHDIRKAIIEIRDKKYPFPVKAKKGNAGSFFKNPVLNNRQFNDLKALLEQNFGHHTAEKLGSRVFRENGKFKVPAAFLLDICGLKDITEGGAKINHNQPLVIINETGKAMAKDVLALAKRVLKSVYDKTNIKLNIEPELVGFSQNELKTFDS